MSILTWCKWFLRLCIPKNIFDDICGDLEEEYSTLVRSSAKKHEANFWLFKHTLVICIHFIISKSNLLSLFVSVAAISISFTMIVSVFWLSDLADASVLTDTFWQQWLAGNTYKIFLEPILWQSIPLLLAHPVDWNLWFYQPSIIYALIALCILYKVTKSKSFSIIEQFLVSMIVVLLPYLFGSALFFFMNITMTEAGPIAAFMWLTTLYLVIPISYQLINKFKLVDDYFT